MAQSCYSPEEAVRLYVASEANMNMRVLLIAYRSERMEKAGGTTIPQFLSTHPSVRHIEAHVWQGELTLGRTRTA